MNISHKSLAVLAVLLAAACASGPRWVPATGDYSAQSGRFTVRLPEGWMLLSSPETVVASRA